MVGLFVEGGGGGVDSFHLTPCPGASVLGTITAPRLPAYLSDPTVRTPILLYSCLDTYLIQAFAGWVPLG